MSFNPFPSNFIVPFIDFRPVLTEFNPMPEPPSVVVIPNSNIFSLDLSSNKNLSNVMNSMSDKQVYGLLASGVINSDLVNEYIKNGKNVKNNIL